MKKLVMTWSDTQKILQHLWGLVILLMVVHRPWASFAMVLLGVAVITAQFTGDKPPLKLREASPGWWALIALFVVYTFGYFRQGTAEFPLQLFERKLAYLVVPVLWFLSRLSMKDSLAVLYRWLVGAVFMAGTVMLLFAILAWLKSGELGVFFYDSFTSPLGISPVYFAFYCALAMFWEGDDIQVRGRKISRMAIQLFLLALLLLSASKLFTIISLLLLGVQWLRQRATWKWKAWHAIALVVLLAIGAGVAGRMGELSNTSLELVKQEKFEYDTPFNGLTLRLVQLRFGLEILSKHKAVMWGVGPAISQQLLNQKYEDSGMYTGDPERGTKGYKAYNFHNQWMETWVATGLLGLMLLLICAINLIRIAILSDVPSSIILIFLSFMFTESLLEREQGIVIFSLFSSMLFLQRDIR